MKSIPSLLVLGFALAFSPLASPLAAGDGARAPTTIGFSTPGAPRTVRIEVAHGDLRVTGAAVDQVTVDTAAEPTGQVPRRADGLRVIAAGNSFNLTERDNVVYLSQNSGGFGGAGADFRITVPRDAAVIVKNGYGGDVELASLSGDVEVSILNGSVKLENIAGGVAVDTMNGEISARYAALPAGKTHAFSSMNGQIKLFVPGTAQATFTLRAQSGTVATDFDEKVFATRTETRPGEGLKALESLRGGRESALEGLAAASEAIAAAGEIASEAVAQAFGNRAEAGEPPEPAVVPAPDTAKAPKAPRPPAPPKSPRMPRFSAFPAFGGQVVTGLLNGGGVEIRATTMNGEIQVREAK